MRVQIVFFSIGLRLLVLACCVMGIIESWKFMRSDALYWQGTAESTRAAIKLEPGCWWCYVQLARLDDKDAETLLQTSLHLNPYNSEAAIDLGLRYEADGDLHRAERLLLQAFAVDRTYGPRWSLANFYFRHDNFPFFWIWARRAAEMAIVDKTYADLGALFELSWRVTPSAKAVEENVVVDDPSVIRQYIEFLESKDQAPAAVHPAMHLVSLGSPDTDRQQIFDLISRTVAIDDVTDSNALWLALIHQKWVLADSTAPNNPDFARDPLPVSFDWALSSIGGLHSWPGPSGLIVEFTGEEPENCIIAEQIISLPPGNYRLQSSYHTRQIAADTGIRWELAEVNQDTVLTSSPYLSSETLQALSLPFSIAQGDHLLRLRLVYRRQAGNPRVSGTLVVQSIRIQPVPST